jgi:hypothetical protein
MFYYDNLNSNHIAFRIEGNEIKEKTCLLKIVLSFGHITNLASETYSKGIKHKNKIKEV